MLRKVNLDGEQPKAPEPERRVQPQVPEQPSPAPQAPPKYNEPKKARRKQPRMQNTQTSNTPRFTNPKYNSEVEARVSKLTKVSIIAAVVAVLAIVVALYSTISANMELSVTRADMTNAVVATQTIAPGSQISAEDLTIQQVPSAYLVDNARSDVNDFVGGYAVAQIEAGSQLTTSLVAGAGNTASLSGAILPGTAAVTISVDEASGLANLLKVGDHVNVVQTDGSLNGSGSTVISANAEIVALGSSLESTADSYSSVTVMVPEGEAQAVRAAQASGNVTLILNPAAQN